MREDGIALDFIGLDKGHFRWCLSDKNREWLDGY
jgi:hypothetical protein